MTQRDDARRLAQQRARAVDAWRTGDAAALHDLIDELSAEPDEGRSFALLMLDAVAQLGITEQQLERAIAEALVELGSLDVADYTDNNREPVMTTAPIRPVDQQRAGRLLLAYKRHDGLALREVLRETGEDPTGTSGLLFAMTAIADDLATAVDAQSSEQQIVRALLHLAREHPELSE